MKLLHATLICFCVLAVAGGCAMCYTPHDDTYNAFGGVAERQDMTRGRVGSILSDPSFRAGGALMGEEPTADDLYELEEGPPPLEEIDPPPVPEPERGEESMDLDI